MMNKLIVILTTAVILTTPVQTYAISDPLAVPNNKYGIHVIDENDLDSAAALVNSSSGDWGYVTIVITEKEMDGRLWQKFFDECQQAKFIPLVRLASKPEGAVWKIPNRHELVSLISFLSALNWPTDQKYIMVLNEVNHAQEFGGKIEPAEYVEILEFTSLWAHSENKNYQVLPAAMDLAANNSVETREAFAYLQAMQVAPLLVAA